MQGLCKKLPMRPRQLNWPCRIWQLMQNKVGRRKKSMLRGGAFFMYLSYALQDSCSLLHKKSKNSLSRTE